MQTQGSEGAGCRRNGACSRERGEREQQSREQGTTEQWEQGVRELGLGQFGVVLPTLFRFGVVAPANKLEGRQEWER